MKRFCLSVVLMFCLLLCSCGTTETFSEGDLLFDCGAKEYADVEKYEFFHEDYVGTYEQGIPITDETDWALFKHYRYVCNFPFKQVHTILLYPSNTFTVTVNGKPYSFFLHEDGSLTSLPDGKGNTLKTYQADEEHRITPEKLQEWVIKYDPMMHKLPDQK